MDQVHLPKLNWHCEDMAKEFNALWNVLRKIVDERKAAEKRTWGQYRGEAIHSTETTDFETLVF